MCTCTGIIRTGTTSSTVNNIIFTEMDDVPVFVRVKHLAGPLQYRLKVLVPVLVLGTTE